MNKLKNAEKSTHHGMTKDTSSTSLTFEILEATTNFQYIKLHFELLHFYNYHLQK